MAQQISLHNPNSVLRLQRVTHSTDKLTNEQFKAAANLTMAFHLQGQTAIHIPLDLQGQNNFLGPIRLPWVIQDTATRMTTTDDNVHKVRLFAQSMVGGPVTFDPWAQITYNGTTGKLWEFLSALAMLGWDHFWVIDRVVFWFEEVHT
ncbi:hypothetical protein GLAREA_06219 [Glarea lozoyensis ATCC 20868]|uniref:Uncharacterized protein n=1 Tax=Glarea lozoyensis (strain ATCC 20868 / MF5171) TaxID=1116229 RepID=S3D411_GLAL2|nr:uncharacterized protein GLAREA_06219 [Glarea lozoyensis ATCC 20868]EPE33207.1 hypothetical protein GLAREA_06219 [Glarea lozoyensis ATCC 20868]